MFYLVLGVCYNFNPVPHGPFREWVGEGGRGATWHSVTQQSSTVCLFFLNFVWGCNVTVYLRM